MGIEMNMFKTTLLMTALLTAPVTFSVLAQTEVAHVSVSAVSGTPSVVEDAIAKLAQERKRLLENYLNAH